MKTKKRKTNPTKTARRPRTTSELSRAREDLHESARLFVARSMLGQLGAHDPLEQSALAFAREVMIEKLAK